NGNGTYKLLIQIPSDSTDPIHFVFQVTDSSGNTNLTAERTVQVLDVTSPVALTGSDVAIDQHQDVPFSAEGSYDNVDIAIWTWTLTDGTGSVVLEGAETTHTFHEAGKYIVRLTVKDPSGNSATDTMDVTVRDITDPVPDAGDDKTVDQNTTVFLDGSGSSDNVAISRWTWTFLYDGIDRQVDGQTAQFVFRTPGVYRITLTVMDRAGNSDSTTVTLTVKDIIDPVPRTPKSSEARGEETVTFSGAKSTDNVGIVNYTWIVVKPSGKVVELYGEEVEYTLSEPGDHEVTLAVSDADGNTVVSDPFIVHMPNMQLWYTLIVIVVASVVATTAIALLTRRKTRRMDEQRNGRR
ncbi:MAG: PKD domain-containing protein, partial [Thermoplasmata archaeon]|nr:PKD domain-containing protein [Thermoplasmata archaeon]